ncbi:MAG: FAD-dependent oxidoreductase [Anaerolineales bacterium]|nr:FAD-dependent oxidoreductase [Anaerolineales bacterium]
MNTVIIGAGYAGLTAALELRRLLPKSETVTVVSASEDFIFLPSLIWIAQGERDPADIAFPIRPVLEEAGIEFICAHLETINPPKKSISLSKGQSMNYDKLLIATGGEWNWDALPGLGPEPIGHTVSILSARDALNVRAQWQALLVDPGPIVIGVTLNTGLYGAAYEFALNLDVALHKAGVRDRASITFITPEPYLGHFGHDGLGDSRHIIEEAFSHRKIMSVTEAQIDHIEAGAVVLATMQRLISKFTMIVPPYRGIKAIRDVPDLADEEGRIPVDEFYRSPAYLDIFSAGIAMQVKPPVLTTLPCGVLIPGTVSAQMGRSAAANIAADFGHGELVARSADSLKSFYVLDFGSQGLFMSLGSKSWLNVQLNIPGPWSHWAKVAAERYQMWQLQSGRY